MLMFSSGEELRREECWLRAGESEKPYSRSEFLMEEDMKFCRWEIAGASSSSCCVHVSCGPGYLVHFI